MALRSKIQWLFDPFLGLTGATWNLWWGCQRTDDIPGALENAVELSACTNCYISRTMPFRVGGLQFDRVSPGGMTPLVYRDRKALFEPLRWRNPLLVFVESLGDLWYGKVPAWRIAEIYAVMLLARRHIFLTLTKRTRRQRNWLRSPRFAALVGEAVTRIAAERRVPAADVAAAWEHLAKTGPDQSMAPLPNVWAGATTECAQTALLRVPELHATPAAVTWLSVEPITDPGLSLTGTLGAFRPDMIVLGGESGPAAHATALDRIPAPGLRPLGLGHLATLVEQANAIGSAVFVKQLGTPAAQALKLTDRKGGDPADWPEHLRVREYPPALAERALRYDPGNRLALDALARAKEVHGA